MTTNQMTIPPKAGRQIVEAGAMIVSPLLGTDSFLLYCSKHGLAIDRKRLIHLERLGLFAPVFRMLTPKKQTEPFIIPLRQGNNWFTKRWAFDTTAVPSIHKVPVHTDHTKEGFYSIFQIDHLECVLTQLTVHIQLDLCLNPTEGELLDLHANGSHMQAYAQRVTARLRDHQYRRTVALLCQHISNRYFPQTQTNMRTIQIHNHIYTSPWVVIHAHDWDWRKEARLGDPVKTEKLYSLTPEMLYNAYTSLAIRQAHFDPIANWYQFISIHERKKLKGEALMAETMRAGANMIRLLYKDLYCVDIPHPNEVVRNAVNHVSELDEHQDVRLKLELIANRFTVKPQPRLSLFVEGKSEKVAITMILEMYFGSHPGKFGIEIIDLQGVGTATGNKKEDHFNAIFRLIDYLHHHQTLTFLILNNENYSHRLKKNAEIVKSRYGFRRSATLPEYIHIWQKSFEFDNFSCMEIASALTQLAHSDAEFNICEVTNAKCDSNPGSALESLYKKNAYYGLLKIKLAQVLIEKIMSTSDNQEIEKPTRHRNCSTGGIDFTKEVSYDKSTQAMPNRFSHTTHGKFRDGIGDRFSNFLDDPFEGRTIDGSLTYAQAYVCTQKDTPLYAELPDDHFQDAFHKVPAAYCGFAIVTQNAHEFHNSGVESVGPWAIERQ